MPALGYTVHIKHMVLISIKCPACPSCPWCLNHAFHEQTPHHTVPVWTTHTLSISHANSFFSWIIDSCSCMHTQSSWLQLLSHLLMQKFRSKSCSKKWHQRRLQAPWERKRNVTIHSCFVAVGKKGKTVQSGEGNIAQKKGINEQFMKSSCSWIRVATRKHKQIENPQVVVSLCFLVSSQSAVSMSWCLEDELPLPR